MLPPIVPEGRTERLLLKPLEIADAPQIQSLFPRWNVVKYLAAKVPWPYPPDGAEQFIRDVALPQMERCEAWHWTIRLLSQPDQIIGAIGLFLSEDENRGFWLAPEHRGQGLMTEACAWANDFWFHALGQRLLRAPKAVANRSSRRLSERMGMRVVSLENRDYVCGRLPSEIWEITAEEWHNWKRSQAGSHPAAPAKRRKSAKSPSAPKSGSPRSRRG
jgi:[ribosomal protein S5]-alanine N-acetyltransferase